MNEWQKMRARIKPEFKSEVRGDATVLTLSGDVVSNEYAWMDSDIYPQRIQEVLVDIGNQDIEIRLNSGGGDAFAGVEIYNYLKDLPNKVTVEVTGLAASAASIIAMGADEIVMCTGSMMMVHEAWTIAMGSKTELLKVASMMDKLDASLVDIYAERIGMDKEFIAELLQEETWMTAEEAIGNGFADRLNEVVKEQELVAKVESSLPDETVTLINSLKDEIAELKTQNKQNKIQQFFNRKGE